MTTSVTTVSTGSAQSVSTTGTANASSGATTLSLDEMISNKVQPYLDQADTVLSQISSNTTKISSFQEMQTLLTSIQSAAANLSSQSVEGSNVFNKRSASLTSTSVTSSGTPSDASTLLSATVADNTATGTHTVVVNQVAQTEIDISSTLSVSTTADASTLLGSGFSSGTFRIYEAGKTSSVDITVSSGDSLSDIASAINNVSDQTGVTASVVSVSSSQSVLVLSGADDNAALTFVDTSGILSKLGVVKDAANSDSVSSTAALGTSGTFQLYNASGSGVDITVSATDTLSDIQTAINAATTTTGITASITAVDSTHSKLVLTSSDGSTITYDDKSGSVLSDLGLGRVAADQVQVAQGANLTVDGVSGITRDTNTISDVISGVTLNLTGADANTKVTLKVGADTSSISTAVQTFVTAYNSWQDFVAANDATNSDGTAASTAVLFGDSTLRSASIQLGSEIAAMALGVTDTSTAVNLAAIGITLGTDNKLEINSSTLSTALTSNLSAVASLFSNTATVSTTGATSGTSLRVSGTNYSTFSGKLTLVWDGTTLKDGSNNDLSSYFTVSGTSIRGKSGTIYSGLNFTFSGTGTLGTVTVTEGLANQLYTTTKNYGSTTTGSLQSLITNLQSEDSSLQSRYTTLMTEAQNYTTFLTQQYATLSAKIASSNQMLVTLKALIDAGNNSS